MALLTKLHRRSAKTQLSLCICAVSSDSLDSKCLQADGEDANTQADLGVRCEHIYSRRKCYAQAYCVSSLRKYTVSNILRILPPIYENFQMINSDIFFISAQNIDCGYSLEPPRWGGSNEYPQYMYGGPKFSKYFGRTLYFKSSYAFEILLVSYFTRCIKESVNWWISTDVSYFPDFLETHTWIM